MASSSLKSEKPISGETIKKTLPLKFNYKKNIVAIVRLDDYKEENMYLFKHLFFSLIFDPSIQCINNY